MKNRYLHFYICLLVLFTFLLSSCVLITDSASSISEREGTAQELEAESAEANTQAMAEAILPDKITMEEIELPDSLSSLAASDAEESRFLDIFSSFDAYSSAESDMFLTIGSIPYGAVFGQTQGIYTFDPKSKQLDEKINLREKNVRAFNQVRWQDQLFVMYIGGEQVILTRYDKNFVPTELFRVEAMDNLNQFPLLTRLEDDVLFVCPTVESDSSKLKIFSLKDREAKLIYEGNFSFDLDLNVPGRKIFRLRESYGDQLYAFISIDEESGNATLFVLNREEIREIPLDQQYMFAYTSGNTVLLVRNGESQPSGDRPQFARLYDFAKDSFNEEVQLEKEIVRCLGLGQGFFLTLFTDKNLKAEARIAETQNDSIKFVKDLGNVGSIGFAARTAKDSACIYCQDPSGEKKMQRLFLLHLRP